MGTNEVEVATAYEHALADELLAEVARQRLTSKRVQELSGVKARAWSNYLTTRNRHLPMAAVIAICDALGVRTSEMLRRAEARLDERPAPAPAQVVEAALSDTSPDAQEAIRRVRRDMGHEPAPGVSEPDAASG